MSRRHALQPIDLDAQQPTREGHGPDLLTQVQVCARLGISNTTWMRWRKAGRTPHAVRLPSGRLKWRASDIAGLVSRSEERSTGRRYFGTARKSGAGQLVAVR